MWSRLRRVCFKFCVSYRWETGEHVTDKTGEGQRGGRSAGQDKSPTSFFLNRSILFGRKGVSLDLFSLLLFFFFFFFFFYLKSVSCFPLSCSHTTSDGSDTGQFCLPMLWLWQG